VTLSTSSLGYFSYIEQVLKSQEQRNRDQECEILNLKRTFNSAIKDIDFLCQYNKIATPSRPHITRTIGTSTISNTKTITTFITPPFKVPHPINFSKNVATSPISSLKICDCCDKVINLK